MSDETASPGASDGGLLARPGLGNGLTLAAGLGFFVLGMLFPLVGQAGAMTTHYAANRVTFHVVLGISLLLAILALVSKLARRRVDGSPFPRVSAGLVGLYVLVGVLEVSGLFAI